MNEWRDFMHGKSFFIFIVFTVSLIRADTGVCPYRFTFLFFYLSYSRFSVETVPSLHMRFTMCGPQGFTSQRRPARS